MTGADISSKAALFRRAFADRYNGRLEYRPQHRLVGELRQLRAELAFGEQRSARFLRGVDLDRQ